MTTIKSLLTQKKKIKNSLKILEQELKDIQGKIIKEKKRLQGIEDRIKKKQNSEIIITEHVLLRYIERILNIDLNELRDKILPDGVRKQVKQLGDGVYPVGNFKIRVVNNSIITIIDVKDQP